MNKYIKVAFFVILVISLFINAYFLFSTLRTKAVLKIDNQVILTQNNLTNILLKKYEKSTTNSILNSSVIKLYASDNSILQPNNEELKKIKSDFPNYVNEQSDENQIVEFYNVYNIYDLTCDLEKDIFTYYNNVYGVEPVLYTITSFTSKDHKLLMKVSDDFKDGKSIEEIEKKFGMNIDISNQPTINEFEPISSEASDDGLFHIDLEDGNMMIVYIKDEIKYNDDTKLLFKDFYFSKRYLEIKANVVNKIKNNYSIEINNK